MKRGLLLSEFLKIVNDQENDQDRFNLFKNEPSPIVPRVLRMHFHPNITWLLPEGTPPYKKVSDQPMGYERTTLEKEYRRLYIFFDPSQNLPQMKRESLFIDMLDGLHYTEAEVLCAAKDRKLDKMYPNIKEDLVRLAFPDMLPPKVEESVKKKRGRKKKVKENV